MGQECEEKGALVQDYQYVREPTPSVRLANSKAGIKPTAPLSVFDKENSIEFLLDLVHYIYVQSNPNPVLLSHASL